MARAQLTNNASTTLSVAVSSTSSTSITLSASGGALFPSSGYFYVSVVDSANIPEIMKCTSRAVDILTVVRAQDNTIARTFTSGARVSLNLTAAVIAELLDNNFNSVVGVLPVANGGTGQPTLALAQAALGFSSGTRLPFAQATAPTGWVQDVTDSANSRMLRVVNGTGNNVGGVDTPILNNITAAHTHTFTSGTESAAHTHAVTDPGHVHYAEQNYAGSTDANGGSYAGQGNYRATSAAVTGISIAASGTTHTHSGTTASTGTTGWAPRYIDLIICAKS